ncbi:hypothetical protein ABHY87_00840 [Phocaeicola vulgatus]
MKKLLLISAATLIVSNSTFAGGILTNTNQHAAFLRMLSRGATTEIDGALSNPVNPEKPYVPLNKNDAFQKVQKRRVQKKR